MTGAGRRVALLPWNDSFSVGHRELDAEHHQMINLINQMCLAADEAKLLPQQKQLLRELERAAELHFEHEEAVLEAFYTTMPANRLSLREMLADYKAEHIADHRKKLGDLGDIRNMNLRPSAGAGAKLCEELRAWFIDHAVGYDARIKTIMQSV